MKYLKLSVGELEAEIARIEDFIRCQAGPEQTLVLGLSGGIDSDVTARLCTRVVGPDRLKCFIVKQHGFEPKFLRHARALASELRVQLIELPMAAYPKRLITIMATADPGFHFIPDGFLDVGRSKNALRTFVFSAYLERGCLVVGTSNKTEIELGYFLPFGDGLYHFGPIAHLYKTQVRQLARVLGTSQDVLEQQPSAAYWIGDTDIEGLAYWLYLGKPAQADIVIDEAGLRMVREIERELSFGAIDTALALLNTGQDYHEIAMESGLSEKTVARIVTLKESAGMTKSRELCVHLSPVEEG